MKSKQFPLLILLVLLTFGMTVTASAALTAKKPSTVSFSLDAPSGVTVTVNNQNYKNGDSVSCKTGGSVTVTVNAATTNQKQYQIEWIYKDSIKDSVCNELLTFTVPDKVNNGNKVAVRVSLYSCKIQDGDASYVDKIEVGGKEVTLQNGEIPCKVGDTVKVTASSCTIEKVLGSESTSGSGTLSFTVEKGDTVVKVSPFACSLQTSGAASANVKVNGTGVSLQNNMIPCKVGDTVTVTAPSCVIEKVSGDTNTSASGEMSFTVEKAGTVVTVSPYSCKLQIEGSASVGITVNGTAVTPAQDGTIACAVGDSVTVTASSCKIKTFLDGGSKPSASGNGTLSFTVQKGDTVIKVSPYGNKKESKSVKASKNDFSAKYLRLDFAQKGSVFVTGEDDKPITMKEILDIIYGTSLNWESIGESDLQFNLTIDGMPETESFTAHLVDSYAN